MEYGGQVTTNRDVGALFDIKQEVDETYRAYTARFKEMAHKIPGLSHENYMEAYKKGLIVKELYREIATKKPTNKNDLLEIINAAVLMEEDCLRQTTGNPDLRLDIQRIRSNRSPKKEPVFDRLDHNNRRPPLQRWNSPPRPKQVYETSHYRSRRYTPGRSPRHRSYSPRERNAIRKVDECSPSNELPLSIEPPPPPPRPPRRHIATLAGGPGGGNDSRGQRKAYAHQSIYQLSIPPKVLPQAISFSDKDLVGVDSSHDDPLIVSPTIDDYVVDRMLVDTGSSVDVLYAQTFDRMGGKRSDIRPLHTALIGFSGHQVDPLGTALIEVTFGDHPTISTIKVLFTIVDIENTSYNGIIGRTTLTALRAVISPMHLMLKFPTPGGIGVMRGDQKRARICYTKSIKVLTAPRKEAAKGKRSRKDYPEAMVLEPEEMGRGESDKEVVPYKDMEKEEAVQATKKLVLKSSMPQSHHKLSPKGEGPYTSC